MSESHEAEVLLVRRVEDWEAVNELLEGFEDGLLKEVWFDSVSWLGEDDRLRYAPSARAEAIVQLQSSRVRSARMSFRGVRMVAIDVKRDVYPAVAHAATPTSWEVEFLGCRIEAEECTVTPEGTRLVGPGPLMIAGNADQLG